MASPFPEGVDPITLGVPEYEDPTQLAHESATLMSETTVVGTLYGVMLTLYSMTIYFLLLQKRPDNRKRTLFYIYYITIMALLGTIYVVTAARDADQTFVIHRLFPLGPFMYGNYTYSKPNTITGTCAWAIINFMADGLVLWRCFVLYKSSNLRFLVILPALMYLGSVALGLMTVIQASKAGQNLFDDVQIAWAVPYFSLSTAMTVLATGMMIARIMYHRRQFQKQFGKGSAGDYTSIVSMLVESAALYAAFQIIFIPLFALGLPATYPFLSSLSQIQIIAPLLIILRVSRGKAWNSRTQAELVSTLAARNRSGTLLNSNTANSRTPSNLKFSVHQEISHHDDIEVNSLNYAPMKDLSREPKAI